MYILKIGRHKSYEELMKMNFPRENVYKFLEMIFQVSGQDFRNKVELYLVDNFKWSLPI